MRFFSLFAEISASTSQRKHANALLLCPNKAAYRVQIKFNAQNPDKYVPLDTPSAFTWANGVILR